MKETDITPIYRAPRLKIIEAGLHNILCQSPEPEGHYNVEGEDPIEGPDL